MGEKYYMRIDTRLSSVANAHRGSDMHFGMLSLSERWRHWKVVCRSACNTFPVLYLSSDITFCKPLATIEPRPLGMEVPRLAAVAIRPVEHNRFLYTFDFSQVRRFKSKKK